MEGIATRSIVYMLLSALCFTFLNSCVRFVDHLPTFELVFFRAIGTVVCCLFILIPKRIPLLGNNKKLLLLRAFFGFTSLSLFFKALQMMPVGTAVSLRYLSPIFAAAIAMYVLKEKMRKIQWLFFAIAFLGVVLLKGFDPRISALALAIVILCAFLSGCVYVTIRKIGSSEHPVVVVFYFLSMSMIIGGIISIFYWTKPVGIEWLILFSMGLFGFFAQLFMTKAMQAEVANKIVPFKYAEAIFTIFAGWMFFGESQSFMTLFAISIIIVALLANVMVKSKT